MLFTFYPLPPLRADSWRPADVLYSNDGAVMVMEIFFTFNIILFLEKTANKSFSFVILDTIQPRNHVLFLRTSPLDRDIITATV